MDRQSQGLPKLTQLGGIKSVVAIGNVPAASLVDNKIRFGGVPLASWPVLSWVQRLVVAGIQEVFPSMAGL